MGVFVGSQHNGPGGHLRLLNSGSLEDVAEQVPAWGGRLLAFANTSPTTRGWHGYTSFSGQRRAIQINWMTEMRKNKYVSLKELKEKLKEAREKRDADNKIRAKAVTKASSHAPETQEHDNSSLYALTQFCIVCWRAGAWIAPEGYLLETHPGNVGDDLNWFQSFLGYADATFPQWQAAIAQT